MGLADFDPSPGASPRGCGQRGGATMLFGVPGAAVDTEVSYEEWQAAYNRHGQQERDSTPLQGSTPPHGSPPLGPQAGRVPSQASVTMVGGVMVAWDSSSECGSSGRSDSQQGGGDGEGGKEKHLRSKEVIKNEW